MNDRFFKIGTYRGYMWCVRRTEAGTVCCYINVSQNAWFRDIWVRCNNAGETFGEADSVVSVHGGITYFAEGVPHGKDKMWKDDIVIGYDYGHYGDTLMTASCQNGISSDVLSWATSIISEEDAEADVKAVIDELLIHADI